MKMWYLLVDDTGAPFNGVSAAKVKLEDDDINVDDTLILSNNN